MGMYFMPVRPREKRLTQHPAPSTQHPISPSLTYAPVPRRRWIWRHLRPGGALFCLILLTISGTTAWRIWKWRLQRDRDGFDACATVEFFTCAKFSHVPTPEALRHLSRMRGITTLYFDWPEEENDASPAALARIDFTHLLALYMGAGVNADPVLKALTRPGSGPKALKTLSIWYVTDAGLKDLSRPDAGLKSLAKLDIVNRRGFTKAGFHELARPDGGLASLRELRLVGERLKETEARELSRPDNGLANLTTLDLSGDGATDGCLTALARPDTGLRSMTELDLSLSHYLTDAGISQLGRPDGGLKSLVTLKLYGTKITDTGLKGLCRSDTGLLGLRWLYLPSGVTDAGLNDLIQPTSGLQALTRLDVGGDHVTDATLYQLARTPAGLAALTTLAFHHAAITDAGLSAIGKARPALRVEVY
jgi:hypothetical protein